MDRVVDVDQARSSGEPFQGVKGGDHLAVQQGDVPGPSGRDLRQPLRQRAERPSRPPPAPLGGIGAEPGAQLDDFDMLARQ